MSDLKDLIARLETAVGPDRELDAEIHAFIHGGYVEHEAGWRGRVSIWHQDKGWKKFGDGSPHHDRKFLCSADSAPKYTASVDSALTLLPAGLDWYLSHTQDGDWAEVLLRNAVTIKGAGATPALALCDAILKARAASPLSGVKPREAQEKI